MPLRYKCTTDPSATKATCCHWRNRKRRPAAFAGRTLNSVALLDAHHQVAIQLV